MAAGYDGRLYILAFDHRGSFKKAVLGSSEASNEEGLERLRDAKRLIFEGMELAAERGVDPAALGVLVDEELGSDVPERARRSRMKLAMPVEKSGQDEFDFEYGEDFGKHISAYDMDFTKVLVRYNPDGDAASNHRQLERLKRLSDWLREHDGRLLFELLVPAEPAQLEAVGGDTDRYDAELRPELMVRAMQEIQEAGIEVDVWKVEGVDHRSDCERLAAQARSGGRDEVVCVLLGRGADDAKVDHWLTQASGVDGFVGFAIGRSIWSRPLADYLSGAANRAEAASRVADNYTRFVSVYESASG